MKCCHSSFNTREFHTSKTKKLLLKGRERLYTCRSQNSQHGAALSLLQSLRPQPVLSGEFPGQQNSILFSLCTDVDGFLRSLARKSWFQWAFISSLPCCQVINPPASVKLEQGKYLCPGVCVVSPHRDVCWEHGWDCSWPVLCSFHHCALSYGSSAFDSHCSHRLASRAWREPSHVAATLLTLSLFRV